MSLALYRKYRPGQFSELIGQDHVTEPLTRALESDRVHHAYLFTGPRGCGKTSSARILARSLNCEQGPTPDPCGECDSCIGLAPNGPGSIDVIELDAATHGLVDDARDLREKAIYAPAGSRYKIYIIDEAHQLGPGAANALLKLIEEPPPHLRFVFATTEPDKIIGTIRSRTHQYAFRLVPTRTLQAHLEQVCASEGVTADPAALALVARAAGGSVRDALSILGQLVAGSGAEGITYSEAVRQLGVTDAALLDDVIAALSAADGAALLRLVDQVVNAGHDPRRFATDLLERLRDLLVLRTVPDAAQAGLLDAPDDVVAAWVEQAEQLSTVELSRLADLVSDGLTELKGATAPRLQLELLAARLITPQVESGDPALLVRIDQLERQLRVVADGMAAGTIVAAPATPAPAPATPPPVTEAVTASPGDGASDAGAAPRRVPRASSATASAAASAGGGAKSARRVPRKLSDVAPTTSADGAPSADATGSPAAAEPPSGNRGADDRAADEPAAAANPADAPANAPADAETAPPPPARAAGTGSAVTLEQIRALWPAVLEHVRSNRRVAWLAISKATPIGVEDGIVTAALADAGQIKFYEKGDYPDAVHAALREVVRADLRLQLVLDPDRVRAEAASPAQAAVPEADPSQPNAPAAATDDVATDDDGPAEPAKAAAPAPPSAEPGVIDEAPPKRSSARVREKAAPPAVVPSVPAAVDVASEDDETIDDDISGIALIQSELGGTVVADGEGS